MTWIEQLFARKPGGTVVGNTLRTFSSILTNGAFGNGAGMITQKQADIRDMNDSDFIKKYGETKSGVKIAGVTPDPTIMSPDQYWANAGNNNFATSALVNRLTQMLPTIVFLGLAVWGLPKIIKSFK